MKRKQVVFFTLMLVGLFISGILVIKSHGAALYELLFVSHEDTFMDFFNCLNHACNSNPYTGVDKIYPAICYVFYRILDQAITQSVLYGGGVAIRVDQLGMFVFVMYVIFTTIMLFCVLKKLYGDNKTTGLFITLILLSAPFLHQFERANIIIIALIFLGIYLIWMDSDVKWQKEAALLALAIASSIKIYPAIFGLLLLKDKRWKDAIHCAIYGILLIVLPFAAMGGFKQIFVWIQSLTHGATKTLNVDFGLGYKLNYSNTITAMIVLVKHELIESYIIIAGKIAYIIALLAFIAACISNNGWKTSALLCSIMIGLPGFSFHYAMIFMVLPLIEFLKDNNKEKAEIVYSILFAFQFILLLTGNDIFSSRFPGIHPLSLMVFLEGVSMLIMTIILCLDVFVDFLKRKGYIHE